MSAPTRVVLIVLDSVGVGELPDAASYKDEGSDTLGNISRHVRLRLPTLCSLGLRSVAFVDGVDQDPAPRAAFGRMAESSPGKDSVTGHWELMGLVLDRPFPVFPDGFPADVVAAFEQRIGRRTLGNKAASGTAIIDELGPEHIRTGWPIVYTSADSVFQIAAHEDVVPVPELYRFCEIAFDLVGIGLGVGRVIARPFVGEPGSFQRTANRRDFALTPFAPTLLDRLTEAGTPVVAIGKIEDLFAGRGISRAVHTASDDARHGRSGARARRDTARPDLRQPGRLRHGVRPSQRPCGLRGQPRTLRREAGGPDSPDRRRRPARHHRRPRQRPDHPEHRSLARARAAPRVRAVCAGGRRSRDAADVRRSGPDARRSCSASVRCSTGRAF